MTTKQTPLEAEALKRKERLFAMKRKLLESEKMECTNSPKEDDFDFSKKPVFRSYNPTNENLKESALPKVTPIEMEEELTEQLVSSKETAVVDEIDLTTLAPRKIDWDLKRDVFKKLEKLERRTQRAIAELIRERLASGKQELLLSAVNSTMKADQGNLSDED